MWKVDQNFQVTTSLKVLSVFYKLYVVFKICSEQGIVLLRTLPIHGVKY